MATEYGTKLRPEPLNSRIRVKLLGASFEIGATDPVGGDQTGGCQGGCGISCRPGSLRGVNANRYEQCTHPTPFLLVPNWRGISLRWDE